MLEQQITIINKLGLHARAAAKLVTLCNQFKSTITIQHNDKSANGKSIMGIMILAAAKDCEILLIIDGEDEQQACTAICELINNRFDEEQ